MPIELPAPGRARLARRAGQTVWVGGRRLGRLAARKALRRPIPAGAFAHPLRLAFEDLGATYVKFGQLVGSAPGVFGDAVSNEFRSCLDTGPAVPFDAVRRLVEEDLGRPLGEVFADFEEAPLAAASIADVYRRVLRDGRRVVVKVLRPGI